MRAHGTHVRYVQGPSVDDEPGKPCRCEPCRAANREYERQRAQRLEPPYVPATPAREHLAWLSQQGVGLKTVARRTGLSHGTLSKLVYGSTGRPPSRRIRPSTLDAILAVRPDSAADGTRCPAGPTLARVDRLVAAGVPKARIAERLGQRGPALQLGTEFVTRRNAIAVKAMVDELDRGELVVIRRSRHGERSVALPPPKPAPAPSPDDHDRLLLDLVEALEGRIDQREWHADAACRGKPPWMFFPGRGDREGVRRALRICGACTVRDRCLEANLDEDDGIWGGTTGSQRRQIRRRLPVAS